MTRIAFITRSFFDPDRTLTVGGSERVVLNISDSLRGNGHEISIYERSHKSEYRFAENGVRIKGVQIRSRNWVKVLCKSAVVDGCNVLVFQDIGMVRRVRNGIPVVGINHGVWWDYPITRETRVWYPMEVLPFSFINVLVRTWRKYVEIREVRKLKMCDYALAFDSSFLRVVQSTCPELRGKITVIPAFSDLSPPNESHRQPSKSSHHDSHPERTFSVFVPRNSSLSSGTRWLADIAVELFKLDPSLKWRLLVPGESVSRSGQDIKSLISNRLEKLRFTELTQRFLLLGYLNRSEMCRYYKECDLVLIPTFAYEGICLSAVEAMSLGKLVVATNVGGLNDSVIDGISGLLTKPNPSDIANSLYKAIVDEELRNTLSAGATTLSQRFTKDKFDAAVRLFFGSIETSD